MDGVVPLYRRVDEQLIVQVRRGAGRQRPADLTGDLQERRSATAVHPVQAVVSTARLDTRTSAKWRRHPRGREHGEAQVELGRLIR